MKRYFTLFSLAVLFGLLASAVPANAQVAFQLSTLQRTVRTEGTTEAVGSVTLAVTTGGAITAGSTISLVYASGTTATNIMPGTGTYAVNGGAATLCSAAPLAPITACAISGNNFTITIGASAWVVGNSIVVSGVRVNANAAGVGATITATATATIPAGGQPITFFITNSGPVAAVANAATATVTPGGGLLTCVGSNSGTFTVKIKENFNQAFTSAGDETGFGGAPGGTVASLFAVTFSGVPVGVTVALNDFTGSSATLTLSSGVSGGTTGGSAVTFPATTGPLTSKSATGSQTLTFTIIVTGTATTGANETIIADFVAFTSGTIAAGAVTVSGPVSLTSTAITSPAAVAQAPQFASNTQGTGTVFGVSDCITNLLFPWIVVDAPGASQVFDTGIAIANTTKDVFTAGGAVPANGACTLTGFNFTTGASVVSSPITVNAGTTAAVVMSTNAATGAAFSNFRGYVIAQCGFLNAHGFAFLTQNNMTSTGTSQGYLALVIPNPALVQRTTPSGGAGEILAH